jgi:hypothetical protein
MPRLLLIGVTPAALRESDQRPPLFECGTGRCAKQPATVLLCQRLLLTDGVPIELGARSFELLLALLEADAMEV